MADERSAVVLPSVHAAENCARLKSAWLEKCARETARAALRDLRAAVAETVRL